MKSRYLAAAATIAACMTMPVAAHHMAEGVVDAEIYDQIEQNLIDADSPHLSIDLTSVSMNVITVVVEDNDADIAAAVAAINQAIEAAVVDRGAVDTAMSTEMEISDADQNGYVTIRLSVTTTRENYDVGDSQSP